jgi:uncharacterized protein
MKRLNADPAIVDLILQYGGDILVSANMNREKDFPMHGGVSTFAHSISVAYYSLYFVQKHKTKNVDISSMIRGALLHDYFLYDWHVHARWHKLHGFRHPHWALENARKEYKLNKKEEDIILKHMFPITVRFPKYRESFIVDWADKVCANHEIKYGETLVASSVLDAMNARMALKKA